MKGGTMKKKPSRLVMVPLSFAVLPYQKQRLAELGKKLERSHSDLAREALTYLFNAYSKMGY